MINNILSRALNRFRIRSRNNVTAFNWDGISSMKFYQNGSTYVLTEVFSGCKMPKHPVTGLIFPRDINKFVEIQQYIDTHNDTIIIAPAEWGYDIYNMELNKPNPVLVYELRFFSIKRPFYIKLARILNSTYRLALDNVK